MLQLIIIFFGPGLLNMPFSWPSGESGRFVAATVALLLTMPVIFRRSTGRIESIPVGQYEAGQVWE